MIELLSVNPARVLNLPGGTLSEGRRGRHHGAGAGPAGARRGREAAVAIEEHPFDGWQLRGGVAATIVGGRIVFVNDDVFAYVEADV